MVYIKVLCGIGNFSGDPFIRFQPTVLRHCILFLSKSRNFRQFPQRNYNFMLTVEKSFWAAYNLSYVVIYSVNCLKL